MRLYCPQCEAEYSAEIARWRCDCGAPVEIRFQARYDKQEITAGPRTLWRYAAALPLREEAVPLSLGEGMTPLRSLSGPWGEAWFKCDFMMPTGSYKDRGAALMLSQLRAWGLRGIIEDSSGNAGAAVAAYSALAGIAARIFIPASASAGKAVQIGLYGAELVRVPGSREKTTEAALKAAAEGGFYASHNWSPWFVHGVKTLGLEIWEQLGWRAPDALVAPVGNGSIILGLYQAFKELREAGLIAELPRIYAVQTAACAPLATAFMTNSLDPVSIEKQETMAEGIASAEPVKGRQILEYVRASGGQIIAVNEAEIWRGLKLMAERGAYIEPTSGTAPAGLLKLREAGVIGDGDEVVVELTGSGLKATDKIVDLHRYYEGNEG